MFTGPHVRPGGRSRELQEEGRVERVGAVLRDLGGGDTLRRRLAQARAFERWPELVGTHLAERTRPLRIADGRLIVLAPGAALRQELMFHKRRILRKFNQAAGGRAARDVVFLESDSLAYDGDAVRAEAPREIEEPAGPAKEEPTGEEKETRAMYEPFDGEAYRRRLERMAGGGSAAPDENSRERS